jgi:hypothetical protein
MDKALADLLVKKWRNLIPAGSDFPAQIAVMLESQDKFFGLSEIPEGTDEAFGADWRVKLLASLARVMNRSPLLKMVSVQPRTGPLGMIFYFSQAKRKTHGGMPEINLQIDSKTVVPVSRKLPVTDIKPDTFDWIDDAFEAAFDSITREVVGTMVSIAEAENNISRLPKSLSRVDLVTAATQIHRRTLRGPANRAVCGPQFQKLLLANKDRFLLHYDDKFPKDKILMWYQGPSILDAAVVYSPYCFMFMGMGEHHYALAVRHNINVVRPESLQLIET